MVFGSLVVLHIWCIHVCVFLFSKNCFQKACSTPPRHLTICRAFKLFFLSQSWHLLDTCWIDRESSNLLDSFSTVRSIDRASVLDMVGCSSTLARHLHLSTTIFSTPTSIDCSTPFDTFICRDLLMAYISSSCDLQLIFVDLSLDTSVFSTPKPLSLTPNLSHSLQTSSSRFLQAFQDFFSLGKFLISHSHAFHVLKPRIWGFLGKFWGFSNLLSFVEILGWVLKIWL